MAKLARPAHTDRQYWLLKSDPETFGFDDLCVQKSFFHYSTDETTLSKYKMSQEYS